LCVIEVLAKSSHGSLEFTGRDLTVSIAVKHSECFTVLGNLACRQRHVGDGSGSGVWTKEPSNNDNNNEMMVENKRESGCCW
jgi:hypothetical protein